ncbi:MAG: hypothetical protein WDN49_23180 [Acetobacteraceae bacterium]
MSHPEHDTSDDATVQAIMQALQSCYGSFEEPNFSKIYSFLESSPYQPLMDAFQSNGIAMTDTTDFNDDVSLRLILDHAGDGGPIEALWSGPARGRAPSDAEGRFLWVTRPDQAPTPLAALVAQTVERAGLKLLDRATVARKIKMSRPDGTGEATLYQALFTDTDRIP